MKRPNKFELYDEVLVLSKNVYGIVIAYDYIPEYNSYQYFIDCEEDALLCLEYDLQLA